MATKTAEINEAIRAKIKELPPLPTVVTKLVKIMDNERSSAEDVTKILSADQALAGQVLRLVNSSFYGMPGEISTISRAVVILGFSAVRNLATGLAVAGAVKGMGSAEDQQRFWDHAIATASAAEVIARRVDYLDPEEAFVAGLLHDIGHLLLAVTVPNDYAAVLADGPDGLVDRENEQLGMAHTRAGQKLLRHWKLPPALWSAVRFHHTPKVITGKDEPLTSLVALADLVAGVHGRPYERSLDDATTLALLKRVGVPPRDVGKVLETMSVRIEETRQFLQIADPALGTGGGDETGAPRRLVVVSADKARTTWAKRVLAHFGWEIVPATAFCAGTEQADAVLLDPTAVTADLLRQVGPVFAASGATLRLWGEDTDGRTTATLGADVPVLPLAFSRSDFD